MIKIEATAIDYVNIDAQKQATEEILSQMEKHLTGSQLYELNKILNTEFNKVIFTKKKEDLHYDIESENKFIVNEFLNMNTLYFFLEESLKRQIV